MVVVVAVGVVVIVAAVVLVAVVVAWCNGICSCGCGCGVVAVEVVVVVIVLVVVWRSVVVVGYLSVYPFVCLSVYLSVLLSISICLSASVRKKLFCETSSLFEVDNIKERSNSARPPQFLNSTTSKTQQCCETSSTFELDNIKKRSNSARHPSKMVSWVQSWRLLTNDLPMRVAFFPFHPSKVLRLPRKSEARSYEVLHLSRKIILANLKIRCSKNATSLRKSAPGPRNMSGEHVSCTAPAKRNASLQILFKCPTPANAL